MRRVLACVAVAVGVMVFGGALAGATHARAPRSFFGIQSWTDPTTAEFQRMSAGHIGTYRFNLLWSVVEYRRGARNWGPADVVVGGAARAGMNSLPVLLSSPTFAARRYQYPPRTKSALRSYATFVRDAALRYGRRGVYWRSHPELPYRPVTAWQVWNEPNFPGYWYKRPNARQYVRFL